MKFVDSISSEDPNAKIYPRMIGYTYNNNTRLFWSSNDYKEISLNFMILMQEKH
jgi:hypothetical protein